MESSAPKRRRTSPRGAVHLLVQKPESSTTTGIERDHAAQGEDEDDQNIFNFADQGRTLSRSSQPEPDLPPTPEHPDPAVSTPPSGIHNTPSKRPKKKSESPLKQPAIRLFKSQLAKGSQSSQPSQDIQPTVEEADLGPEETVNPEQRKLQWLEEQVQQMRQDLEVANLQPFNAREVVGLLRRHVSSHTEDRAAFDDQQWFGPEFTAELLRDVPDREVEADIFSWLISGNTPGYKDFYSHSTLEVKEQLPEPKSHHPLRLPAADALPFLESFAPLKVKGDCFAAKRFSSSENGDADRKDTDILRHRIQLTSQPPFQGLFTANIETDVNIKSHLVEGISCSNLEPGAAPELEPFINSICHPEKNGKSVVKHNLGVLGWGMAEWHRVAVRRARFWKTLDKELVNKDDDAAKDLRMYMGLSGMSFPVPRSQDGSSLFVRWKIDFDWTGEARSRISVEADVPASWREFDKRETLDKLPQVFDDLLFQGEDPVDAVRKIVTLMAPPGAMGEAA